MDFSLVWKTVITIIYGALVLRIAGRKSLSQMTIVQTVVMLAVGTVLIEPLVGTELINTYIVVAVAVFTLIAIEYAEIKFPCLKKLFTGKPILIVKDGEILRDNLKHVRMTIQQLEMELRQASVTKVSEVKWATLEPNGQFGYVLKEEFQSISKQEYQYLLMRLDAIEKKLSGSSLENAHPLPEQTKKMDEDIFVKVTDTP